jgi:serine/threonine protein kinase
MGILVMPTSTEKAKFDVGSTVGDYQLVKRIDSDVAGDVFLASQQNAGGRDGVADVVLHISPLKLGNLGSSEIGTDNAKEADRRLELLASVCDVTHPFLARTIQVFRAGDQVCVATQPNDGNSLAETVTTDGPIPSELVYMIVRQVALTIKCVHDHGHIHGSLQPQTVFLQASGDVQLLGLGPAMLCRSVRCRDVVTQDDHDARCDLVALGNVTGFLLAGHVAFDNELLPMSWQSIVHRMKSSQTDQGYRSIDDAIRELDRVFDPSWNEVASRNEDPTPSKPILLLQPGPDEAPVFRTDATSTSSPSFRSWLLASCRQLFSRR